MCILYILHIVHIEHIYLHTACVRPWLCPRAIHIMHILWHIMHVILQIYWHILHIGSMIYCAYSAYLLTYCFNNLHIMHIMHIVFILVIFYIFCIFCVQDSFQCLWLFIPIIAWPPIQEPSCSLTTTYIHHHCSGFCHKKLQESPLNLFACTRVLSPSHPMETVSDAVKANV